ncbi:MAG: hypothetical protein ACXV7D_17165 [Thermoanaerobaculia bacterium]
MKERYRKWGRVVRFERDSVISVEEAGEAVEDGQSFTVRPLREEVTLPVPAADVEAFGREVAALVPFGIRIERMIVSTGIAEHEFGGERWRETSARMHLALVEPARQLRATLELGGELLIDLPLADVRVLASALLRAGGRVKHPRHLVVAPSLAASLLPALLGVDGITLMQTAGDRDGKGARISEQIISTTDAFPNWFRPSYRIRPVRMPFHLCALSSATEIDPLFPRAVAILRVLDRLRFDVLCDDGSSVFEAPITIDRVRAVGAPAAWYPYGAGAFGSEMLL